MLEITRYGSVPELRKDIKVVLLGDSRGYVPSSFKPGEEVILIKFREPFKDGNSEHIVLVSSGTMEGWVKPSNIQKNVAEKLCFRYEKLDNLLTLLLPSSWMPSFFV